MYKGKRIAVIVPAYNEERLIGVTLETMPEYVDRIIVVDDASTDDTAVAVEAYRSGAPDGKRVDLVIHAENQGVGGANASGYAKARDEGYDVAVVMNGDAQMDPDDLPRLLDPVVEGRADYAKGNRLFTGDAWNVMPRVRYLGNSMLSLLTKIASGYWQVADSQCGYTALGRRALETVEWKRIYRRYGHPNDLLVRLNVFNFRVVDVPVKPIYGIGEESGVKPMRMIPALALLMLRLFLFRMWNKYVIRDFHPLVFFYTFGVLFLLPGLAFGSYLLGYRLAVGPVTATSALFAVFLFVSGLQLVLFAMWFDMLSNRDRDF